MELILSVRDDQFAQIGTIKPLSFVCSIGLASSASNDIQFVTKLDEDELIEVGSFVTYGLYYGGRVMSRDINFKTKLITYSGKSLWGVMDNFIGEWGTIDRHMTIESEVSDPGCQHLLSGQSASGMPYPNNSPRAYCHFVANNHGIGIFDNVLTDIFPLKANYYHDVDVVLGNTLGSVIEQFMNELQSSGSDMVGDAPFKQICRIGIDATNNKITVDWRKWRTHIFDVSYRDQEVIVTSLLKQNVIIDKSTAHYYANDGTYKSANVSTYSSDAKFKGIASYQIWNPNDDSNAVNQQNLKQIREGNTGALSTQIVLDLDEGDEDFADIGDDITIWYRPAQMQMTQRLVEKTFEFSSGYGKITYTLNGGDN